MLHPCGGDGIAAQQRTTDVLRLAQARESLHHPRGVAHDPERVRRRAPPGIDEGGRLGTLLGRADRRYRCAISGAGGFDRELVGAAREERIADDRVLDEVEHVGGVAPEIGPPGGAQLRAQAGPRGAAVGAVTGRVGCLEQRARGHAHRVVNHQALGAKLDKRERAQRAEQLGRVVVGQHRLQEA